MSQVKPFKSLQPGGHIFTLNPYTSEVVHRVVKSVEGYNHRGNPNYLKVTFYVNIQKTENFTQNIVVDLATKLGKEGDISTKTIIVPANSHMIHTVELVPQPYATSKEIIDRWLAGR